MKDLQQNLMNEVYEKWNTKECKGMERLKVINKFFTLQHKCAVQMGNFNYQVCNGGFSQWYFNGYLEKDIDDLIKYMKKGSELGLKTFKIILDVLLNIDDIELENEIDGEEEYCELIDEYNDRYDNLQEKNILNDMNKFLKTF